jgi:hypothetical protein
MTRKTKVPTMSSHGLTRNQDNEPACLCGYRPSILDEAAPVGKQWKARTAVLEHAEALNDAESANEWEAALDALAAPVPAATPQRSPEDPFPANHEQRYPRAGIRRTEDGQWLLTFWDGMGIQHHIDEPEFKNREDAFDYGWMTIGACRQSGTNLNGWAVAV